ncbi:hypothetical protein CBM2633_A50221 [Cupriavidus taiwanensis]|uniref:Uncharacterized protein n=1 Tax=Cupriavidus taiwanensis TaxID=164546 RepID=A0A976ATE6_9BURK|nr:hypothetical protein CBM2604_A60045 [Cupriavidus taiwanensis]SOZ28754.1 hypothetical protein CBM2609_A70047 [Cupriavidus taiwanensis]SOZ46215.1 hypothetical protein CBM2610_A80002 [Cupriavidus taiwanensis]SOZ49362.1 hypothetical protein CBM2615_A120174 [Cupriavidus taiwanensis]SOZ49438.1 hypothetical protein CBM2614_A120172 [Cupriavidus taiwanensis]
MPRPTRTAPSNRSTGKAGPARRDPAPKQYRRRRRHHWHAHCMTVGACGGTAVPVGFLKQATTHDKR